MNRFYCTVCQKIKRVQHYPENVENKESTNPYQRRGQCRRHSGWTEANEAQANGRFNRKVG